MPSAISHEERPRECQLCSFRKPQASNRDVPGQGSEPGELCTVHPPPPPLAGWGIQRDPLAAHSARRSDPGSSPSTSCCSEPRALPHALPRWREKRKQSPEKQKQKGEFFHGTSGCARERAVVFYPIGVAHKRIRLPPRKGVFLLTSHQHQWREVRAAATQ